jgi:hypothetical protein
MDIDPNMLLRNFRNAVAVSHLNMAALAMATLDEQLRAGGKLPDAWHDAKPEAAC